MAATPNNRSNATATDSYLSPEQLEAFRQRLLEQQQQLHAAFIRLRRKQLTGSDRPIEAIDRSEYEKHQNLALGNQQRLRNDILRIEAALERIDQGEYGYCLMTGEEIGLRRLNVAPTATLCLEAQQRVEQRERVLR